MSSVARRAKLIKLAIRLMSCNACKSCNSIFCGHRAQRRKNDIRSSTPGGHMRSGLRRLKKEQEKDTFKRLLVKLTDAKPV